MINCSVVTGGTRHNGLIRVLIADDHAIVRDGIRSLIEAHAGFSVVGEAANGHEACLRASQLQPDVLLLDLSMPGMSGVLAAEQIVTDCPMTKVLVLTMHEERGYVGRLLRAGAAGYVLKRTESAELVRAISIIAKGGTYVDPSLVGTLLTELPTRMIGELKTRSTDLTVREGEVLRFIARGYSNKEIATVLQVSVKTVETHKANGMAKLGVSSRAALVRFAMSEHWLNDAGE